MDGEVFMVGKRERKGKDEVGGAVLFGGWG
jgi:hypothetical protein